MNKTYPKLYARTATGATQLWYVEQSGASYRSVSGQINGILTTADWTIAVPTNDGRSNARSAIDQATFEIDAKYKKQLKSGGYFLDIKDIDKDRFFQVMLAKSFEDYRSTIDWSKGVGVQIKYNGGRIVARKEGLFTRKGEQYISIPHVEEALQPFFKKFPDAVLDGEGFNYDLRERLNEIMKLLRKTVHVTSKDFEKSKELIRYYIYDGFGIATRQGVTAATDDYKTRKSAIDNAFFAACFYPRYKNIIAKVPTWYVKSEAELEKLYQGFLEEKHEGAILRIVDAPYENKRSKNLLKYKPVDDNEFEIVDVLEGVGKFAGRIATVTCQTIDGTKYADDTRSFNATFKGTEAQAIEAWKTKQDLVGKIVTIYYNGLTGKGKPNYPRFDYENFDKGN